MSALKTRRRPNGGAFLPATDEEKGGRGAGAGAAGNERNMTVAVRIRPLSQRELDAGHASCCQVVHGNIVAIRKGGNAAMYLKSQQGSLNEYCFDAAFDPTCSQREIYEKTAKPMIPTLLDGYNVTVFAYGATGAGKTHTMMGSSRGDDSRNGSEAGIIPNALSDVFTLISNHQAEALPTETWNVSVSFMEVYNEQVFDLLEPTGKVLSVREDPERGMVIVAGLTQQQVASTDHVLQLLVNGNKNRKTESTMANQVSSRSHAILQLIIKHRSHSSSGQEIIVESVLSLIDLAGSERASATNNTGTRLQEGANINKSLLALANCINALSSSSSSTQGNCTNKRQNVKYRDSKLTHLLKSSLEGHCHVIMIANINPSHHTFEDSHNTLKYANRAKNIKINPLLSADTNLQSSLSSSSLTQQEIAQWMERENGLREENKELRLKIDELNEVIQELNELHKKKMSKCCVCGLRTNAVTAAEQEGKDENLHNNSSSLPSPLPSKSPLRPNSSPLSPLASKKGYSYSPSVVASFSTFEAKYQYPSIEQLSEALEDPLCLSEDLLSDTKPNTSNQLKNRIAQLSVITQKQQEMFQNILQDTEKTRRESIGMRRRKSSISMAASRHRSKVIEDETEKSSLGRSQGSELLQSQSRRASLPLGALIYQDADGTEESKGSDGDNGDEDTCLSSKKRRYSLVPTAGGSRKSTNILKDRSNTLNSGRLFKDPIDTEKVAKKLKTEVLLGDNLANENVNPQSSSKLRRNSISSTSTSAKRRLASRAI